VLEQSASIDLNDPSVRLETVRAIWREILGVSELEDDISFFEAGGNSLLLVALVEELSRVCGRMLKTMDVFRAASVERQADLLAQREPDPAQIMR
jgi:glutamate racemase